MAAKARDKAARSYILRVDIEDIRPPIWRRLRVPGTATLGELHTVLQHAFGWTESHLHQFKVRGEIYGRTDQFPDPDPFFDRVRDEDAATVAAAVGTRLKRFFYEYDFGDGWRHVLKVERIDTGADAKAGFACLAGKRAGPLEDCGGVWGYYNIVEMLENPGDGNDELMEEWVPEGYDPEAFDIDALNRVLSHWK